MINIECQCGYIIGDNAYPSAVVNYIMTESDFEKMTAELGDVLRMLSQWGQIDSPKRAQLVNKTVGQ